MKVVLVDDERHVREAVRLLVDWDALGIDEIHEAANGVEAIALIKSVRPEIVVTDMMMPVRGGLDLLAWLQANRPEIQKIVISGHDDFHLVRGTMQHGGQDYLLKPIDPEQLSGALRRAVDSWREQDRSRRQELAKSMELNQMRPVMRDRIFTDLLAGADPHGQARSALRALPGAPSPSRGRVVVLRADSASAEVRDRYARNRELLYFTLTNIADELLLSSGRGLACRNLREDDEILLFCWASGDEPQERTRLHELLQRINEGCSLTLRSRFDFGIGSVQPFPGGAALSYQEAKSALRERDMLAPRSYYYERPAQAAAAPSASAASLESHEESLHIAALSGADKPLRDAVGRWAADVRRLPRISAGQFGRWQAELADMLRRWEQADGERPGGRPDAPAAADRSGGESPAARPPALFDAPPLGEDGRLDLERLESALLSALSAWAQGRGTGGSPSSQSAIPAVVRYIEQHYNKELTLQDIASHFYLSREYISRRFKQETGENLIDFLCRTRIDKAKRLLESPHLKISQVAEMVGYADEKYFSKVFKKWTGLSPNQYRKG